MRAHLIQMDLAWEDKHANHELARRMTRDAHPDPGDLIVLPELFDTGFSFNLERTADTDGATLDFLSQLARDTRCFVHGSRTLLAHDARGRNMATIVAPDAALVCEYAKVHPFSYGRESERFTGGNEVVTWTIPLPGSDADPLTLCPAVCYDLRFPELFRIGLSRGAEVFVLGANWPAARKQHWRALAIARAIENQALVLAVNRCGNDPHLPYAGGTIAIGPKGDILAEAGQNQCTLSVEIDPASIRAWRAEFPAWRDRRL